MFYVFSTKNLAPYIFVEQEKESEIEVLETNLLGQTFSDTTVPDFWRVSFDGRGTIIRPYREDRNRDDPHMLTGRYFSPRTLVRELVEFLTFVSAMSTDGTDLVKLRFSWWGLANRQIRDFDPGIDWQERTSRVDHRNVEIVVEPSELISRRSDIVAYHIANPVLRLFDGLEIEPKWIDHISPTFHPL